MSKAKKPAPEELAYNKNLRAEIETDVNDSPRARVHQVEWRKIMVIHLNHNDTQRCRFRRAPLCAGS